VRLELITRFIVLFQRFVVIDLAVTDDDVAGVVVHEGLMTLLSGVHDGQSMKAEGSLLVGHKQDLGIVGTAMAKLIKVPFEVWKPEDISGVR